MAVFPCSTDRCHRSRISAGLDAWFADHFGFADTCVLGSKMSVDLLGASPTSVVRSVATAGCSMETVKDRGIGRAKIRWPPVESEVANWRDVDCPSRARLVPARLSRHRSTFTIPIHRLSVICIGASFQVDRVRSGRASVLRADQSAFDGLHGAPPDVVLDVRPELLAARPAERRDRTFDVTDSHWNERGAFSRLSGHHRGRSDVRCRRVPPARARSDFEGDGRDRATAATLPA